MKVNLHFERRGAGTPLVLLHGIGHHWQAWLPVLDRLALAHDVIAVDLPGFGSSPMPPGGLPEGMASAVDLLARFFAQQRLGRPHVAGNSLGGAIALELGAAGLAASVTAFSPAGFQRPWEARLALFNLRSMRLGAQLPEAVQRRVFATAVGRAVCFGMVLGHPTRMPAEQAMADSRALRAGHGFEEVARYAGRYRFTGSADLPVTIAWGTRDRVLLPRQALRARDQLPAARHVSLPGAGHVPMLDEPELVAELILATTAAARTAPA